jgi:hypothetical protein
MKIIFILLIIMSFTVSSCNGQNLSLKQGKLEIAWEKLYSNQGVGSGKCVQEALENGYIVVGDTANNGWDGWLIRIDASGKKLWEKTYGGKFADYINCVQPTSDGGFVFTGSTMVGSDWKDAYILGEQVWLVKTDANGQIIWEKTFGGKQADIGHYVLQTSDNGFMVLAVNGSIPGNSLDWLIKVDYESNELWNKTVTHKNPGVGLCIQPTIDKGYIIVGESTSDRRDNDILLFKIDADGNEIWEKNFGGNKDDVGHFVQATLDGGYILIGDTESFGAGYSDIWIIKVDAIGEKIWDKTYGGAGFDTGTCIKQTMDCNYVFVGGIAEQSDKESSHWYSETSLSFIKLDSSGNSLWQNNIGIQNIDEGRFLIQDIDGNYVITGTSMKRLSLLDRLTNIYHLFDIGNEYADSMFIVKITSNE